MDDSRIFWNVFTIFVVIATCVGCSANSSSETPQGIDESIRSLAASTLPRKVDAATTVVDMHGDGHGGIITVAEIDTSRFRIPSEDSMKHKLCDVGPDSPPMNSSPYSSITYIYRDLAGNEFMRFHFNRGECPGDGL